MVEYKKRVENVAADALSRRSEEDSPPLNNRGISIVVPSWLEAVKSMVQNSPFFAHLKQQWEEVDLMTNITGRQMNSGVLIDPSS